MFNCILVAQVNNMAKWFAWGDWCKEEIMHGPLPQLLYSWDLKEQRHEEEGERF